MGGVTVREISERISGNFIVLGENRQVDLKFLPVDSEIRSGISFVDHPGVSEELTRRPLDLLDEIPEGEFDTEACVKKIHDSAVQVILCPLAVSGRVLAKHKTLLFVENPRLTFMNLVASFHKEEPSIHPTAVVGDCVLVGKGVSIGAYSVIGGAGFGTWRMKNGSLRSFPQIGGVRIGDQVSIHANVCIDRGALGDTVIGSGTRIDNLCHIAHNVKIGRNVSIVASSMIAGSVEIGDDSWIAPGSLILNGVRIGRGCVVGMGSVVLADVPDGATVKGLYKG